MATRDKGQELRQAAHALGLRFAVAGACLVALLSLRQQAPLGLACLRGLATLLLLAAGARLGSLALSRAQRGRP
jgi:hypothetical protein